MHFWLFKIGIANVYDIHTIYGRVLGRNSSSKHPLVGQYKVINVREMAWVCRLCGSSVVYSHHRVCSIVKKKKLARKTSIKDKHSVTIDDDLPNLVCEVQGFYHSYISVTYS